MENKEELYEIDINESINNENTIETETNSNNINNSNEKRKYRRKSSRK